MVDTKKNLLVVHCPDIAKEWDFENNKNIDINNITFGSNKKYFWICPKCTSSYDASPANRKSGYKCAYCRGLKVNHTNSLYAIRPDVAKQWHPTLNGDLTPNDVTKGYGLKVWWMGECGHNWDSRVSDRLSNSNCPYCTNKRVLIGFNDLWTTHSHIAEYLTNPADGYEYTHGSGKKVSWSCIDCKEVIGIKIIKTAVYKGINCPSCRKTHSLAERIMSLVLRELDIAYETQKSFDWLSSRRYDFYIESENMIIETHGEQHYKNSYKNGRSLLEEQQNDIFKESSAKENGIIKYLIIDCEKSDFNYIKKSIINSKLSNLYDIDSIDWKDIFIKANKSTVLEVCEIYNEENITQKDIAERLKISTHSVIRYLSLGAENGFCEYEANSKKNKDTSVNHMKKPVVQLSLENEYIRTFSSISEASNSLGRKNSTGISGVCAGRKRTSGGYIWMYEEVYRNK